MTCSGVDRPPLAMCGRLPERDLLGLGCKLMSVLSHSEFV
jgi:hypothetical protein